MVLDGVLEREAQLTGQPLELGPNLLRVDLDLALELTRGVRAINSPAALITSHGAQRLARPRPSIDDVDAEQVLAFRLARSGLARRDARSLAEAARCPASDFTRDAALLALAARRDGVSRGEYDEAVDRGDLVIAHALRGAIHASLAPRNLALYGRALIATEADELGLQLGRQVRTLAAEKGFSPTDALAHVAEATEDALRDGRALSKHELHDELRRRVGADLMPWCRAARAIT